MRQVNLGGRRSEAGRVADAKGARQMMASRWSFSCVKSVLVEVQFFQKPNRAQCGTRRNGNLRLHSHQPCKWSQQCERKSRRLVPHPHRRIKCQSRQDGHGGVVEQNVIDRTREIRRFTNGGVETRYARQSQNQITITRSILVVVSKLSRGEKALADVRLAWGNYMMALPA